MRMSYGMKNVCNGIVRMTNLEKNLIGLEMVEEAVPVPHGNFTY